MFLHCGDQCGGTASPCAGEGLVEKFNCMYPLNAGLGAHGHEYFEFSQPRDDRLTGAGLVGKFNCKHPFSANELFGAVWVWCGDEHFDCDSHGTWVLPRLAFSACSKDGLVASTSLNLAWPDELRC